MPTDCPRRGLESTADWQRRFRAQPHIWYTLDRNGEPLRFYESEEAARMEVAFYLARGAHVTISSQAIHSLALAAERWRIDREVGR